MSQLRIVLVDDHPVMRTGIRLLLEGAGMKVCGEAPGVVDALTLLDRVESDVVLVDLSLGPDGDGLELLAEIVKRASPPKPLVYSMREDAASIEDSLEAGALGYVTKAEVWETLVSAVQDVHAGKRYLSPQARRSLHVPTEQGNGEGMPNLSAREREVFRLLGEGFARAEIASRLGVSPRTVESYCSRLLVKLELRGMRELRRRAIASRH